MPSRSLFCLVLPVRDAEEVVEESLRRVLAAADARVGKLLRVLVVDDGSSDSTAEKVLALRERERRVGLIRLSRPFGFDAAVMAGLHHSRRSIVAIPDPAWRFPWSEIESLRALLVGRTHHVLAAPESLPEALLRDLGEEEISPLGRFHFVSPAAARSLRAFHAPTSLDAMVAFAGLGSEVRRLGDACFEALPNPWPGEPSIPPAWREQDPAYVVIDWAAPRFPWYPPPEEGGAPRFSSRFSPRKSFPRHEDASEWNEDDEDEEDRFTLERAPEPREARTPDFESARSRVLPPLEFAEEEIETMTIAESPTTPVKRGRGRPRKVASAETPSDAAPQPKRPRGRPRKNPI